MRWEQGVLVVARSAWSTLVTVPGRDKLLLLTIKTALASLPSLILSDSLSPFFGPAGILLEAFICLKSYRRTL